MDEARFVLPSRENPRTLGFASPSSYNSADSTSNKAMSNDFVQKPLPTILERFRGLLKDREEGMKISDDDYVPPPGTDEIVRLYELVLSELTFNSKPLITDLTIIAGEQREHGEGIADAICARIIEVPGEQKLPSLYLLDSIVKNIGREYVRHFSTRLPEVFCEAYRQVNPNLHPAMRHLFGTWSAVFPQSTLRKIEAKLQFSPAVNHQSSGITSLKASESPRPAHGIHVNPKYLEARRQFEQSPADSSIQHPKGTSKLKVYAQKPAIGYDYDSDRVEVTSSLVGVQQSNSTGGTGRTSFALGADKPFPSSSARIARPSPSRIGISGSLSPRVDELPVGNSPRGVVEGVSPSHPGYDFGLGRIMGRDEESKEWRRRHWSDDTRHRFETSAFNHSNGRELQGPRALIDAYGNDRRERILNDKPLKVQRLEVNGISSKVPMRTWQNTEEEEYDWEDMSPTLADRSRSNDLPSSSVPDLVNFRTRPGLGALGAAPLELDFRRRNWSSHAQLPSVDNSLKFDEGSVSNVGSSRGSVSRSSGFQNERNQIQGSRYPQEAWNMLHNGPRLSQHSLNSERRGFQIPVSASGISSVAGEKMPVGADNFADSDAELHTLSTFASRTGSSSLNSMNLETHSAVVPSSTGIWPPVNVHKSYPPPMLPVFPQQKQIRSRSDLMNSTSTVVNHGPEKYVFLPDQRLVSVENKALSSTKLPPLPNRQAGLIPFSQPNPHVSNLQPQVILSQESQENFVSTVAASVPSHLGSSPMIHGYTSQGPGVATSAALLNQLHHVRSSVPFQNIPNSSLHLQGGTLPPLPPGPPPASSPMVPLSQGPIINSQPPGGAFSGLISSLVAQGLISLTAQAPTQDSVGVEFNPDILKIRHESAIKALYADLPRQCTTCGLRFKCQEEHSSHMDWHVTKNRISKNRKQKPSRKWFVSASMWLSGAETLGTDAVPGFLPAETVMEKKDDEEMAVPADEDQNVCALCGEPFDDFYCDETDEWMYKGAIYMNAPSGITAGMDRSQLGPIVHAKCRSESSAVSPEDFVQDERGSTEEGSQRKQMRD
ncbi:polyadenylation and cleavage factor homolog 4 [Malania oleifera]|uniref:polyadenylation and cleavage factor homolog 4 n=1 Tax=Malania oleifera TaxID=397392 RepID=UPI0025AE2B5A|nr:polyadenylation and cleavage factor homolog 4 [Malania oleifera]